MKKLVLSFLAGVLLTFFIMSSLNRFASESDPIEFNELKQMKSDLKSISENEYQDYLKLKDAEEKYKKADEILGKIMILFLADLSLHVKNKSTEASADVAQDSINLKDEAQPKNEIKARSAQETQNPQPTAPNIKNLESKLLSAQTESEALKILKELEIKDIEKELKTAKTMSEKQLNMVKGKYVGVVNFDNQKEPWRIEWELSGEIVDGKVEGKQLIILSNSQKVFSRSRGNGNIKDFAAFAGDSTAILINSYGDDGYIQLYPYAHTGKMFGNYYLKEENTFKKIGIVLLEKVN